MSAKAVVQIVGAQIACSEGYQDAWRDAAEWAAGTLNDLFGDAVQVEYFDLFEPECPSLPSHVQLPLILINNEVVIHGETISIPAIRKRLEELGVPAISH